MTEKEFVEYYKNISAITEEDNVFNLVIGNTWGLKGDGPTYKRNPKHIPKTEEPATDYLPSHKTQNVMRSGMGSSGNPLNNTNQYYPPTNSAQRGNFTGAMARAPNYVDDVESMISGQTPKDAPR